MSPIESILIPEASEAGPPLNCEERIRLAQLETLIQGSLEKFLLAGRALLEIKTRRLYRHEYSTFQDYCMKRWAISERRGLDLVRSTAVAENLLASPAGPSGDAPLPPVGPEHFSSSRLRVRNRWVPFDCQGQIRVESAL